MRDGRGERKSVVLFPWGFWEPENISNFLFK
jgi:hypothetical protein